MKLWQLVFSTILVGAYYMQTKKEVAIIGIKLERRICLQKRNGDNDLGPGISDNGNGGFATDIDPGISGNVNGEISNDLGPGINGKDNGEISNDLGPGINGKDNGEISNDQDPGTTDDSIITGKTKRFKGKIHTGKNERKTNIQKAKLQLLHC